MRTFSSNMLRSLLLQHTNEVLLFLVTVEHADWGTPVRLVNDRVDILSNGETYNAYPFEFLLPAEDTERAQVQTKIILDNVDRQVIALLRELATFPTVMASLILASTPDTIEYGPAEFQLTAYDYDAQTITGYLSHENVLTELIPGDTFNPAHYPGLH